jgi:hypothetical protein
MGGKTKEGKRLLSLDPESILFYIQYQLKKLLLILLKSNAVKTFREREHGRKKGRSH